MKTKEDWEKSTKDFDQFITIGDEIDSAIFYYFMGIMLPAKQGQGFFLCGEPSYFDGKQYRYMKFSERKGHFYFDGYFTLKQERRHDNSNKSNRQNYSSPSLKWK